MASRVFIKRRVGAARTSRRSTAKPTGIKKNKSKPKKQQTRSLHCHNRGSRELDIVIAPLELEITPQLTGHIRKVALDRIASQAFKKRVKEYFAPYEAPPISSDPNISILKDLSGLVFYHAKPYKSAISPEEPYDIKKEDVEGLIELKALGEISATVQIAQFTFFLRGELNLGTLPMLGNHAISYEGVHQKCGCGSGDHGDECYSFVQDMARYEGDFRLSIAILAIDWLALRLADMPIEIEMAERGHRLNKWKELLKPDGIMSILKPLSPGVNLSVLTRTITGMTWVANFLPKVIDDIFLHIFATRGDDDVILAHMKEYMVTLWEWIGHEMKEIPAGGALYVDSGIVR